MYIETHITVDNNQKDFFLDICEKNGIKTTEIGFSSELCKENHLMTSIKNKLNNIDINNYLEPLYFLFKDINILRSKIEVDKAEKFKYIETHLSINKEKLEIYNNLNLSKNWVISFNINRSNVFSITRRIYNKNKIKDIENDFEELKSIINEKKLELEYCIYDSNVSLDYGWID